MIDSVSHTLSRHWKTNDANIDRILSAAGWKVLRLIWKDILSNPTQVIQMVKAAKFSGPISLHVEYGENSRDKKFFASAFRQDLGTLRDWLAA